MSSLADTSDNELWWAIRDRNRRDGCMAALIGFGVLVVIFLACYVMHLMFGEAG